MTAYACRRIFPLRMRVYCGLFRHKNENMIVFRVAKKRGVFICVCCLLVLAVCAMLFAGDPDVIEALKTSDDTQWEATLQRFFDLRNDAVLRGDDEILQSIYLTGERNGRWAYENELVRSAYLKDWAAKQGVTILNIHSDISLRSVKEVGRGYSFYLTASTLYEYAYDTSPDMVNGFRLGTYHSIDLIPGEEDDTWVISREWYDDPLSGGFDADAVTDEMTQFISGHAGTDLSGLDERRTAAVAYADMYCGAASDGSNEYRYNSNYTNFNDLGGDCANFASQVLFEGGGFKKTATWNYRGGKGSRAWVNAQAFRTFLSYSGRGSQIAKGKYKDVYQSAYGLLPGDIVAYVKKGKVTHIAVVTGLDSNGYPLVSCHNADRNRVPWDIGWHYGATTFILIHVNY